MLKGQKILLGVTGSIAAYKSALIVRNLVKAGAEVRVILTSAATEFVTPLTLSTLSKNPVITGFVDEESDVWNNHVELGLWADLFLIAPVTANTLAKMATGQSDNFLVATYLSARCPVVVAPAMDVDMYQHNTTAENLEKLVKDGVQVISAQKGELASGLIGEGRLAEPEDIQAYLEAYFTKSAPLVGKKAVVTAGPTYEPIDAVRFIGNHSSGKMGYALAVELAKKGCEVYLVSGPVDRPKPEGNVELIKVQTAAEMYEAVNEVFQQCDIAIMSAAVADFTPSQTSDRKIKKEEGLTSIELSPTVDILKSMGAVKRADQILVGFALETDNEIENAQKKLTTKNLNFIVLNSLQDEGAGFGTDTNKVTLLDNSGAIESFEVKEKTEVARDIVRKILEINHG